MSVGDRLARLLFIVPYVADRDGVPLSELAEKLDVKPAQIEADLALLSMVGQPPLTPDHLIDLYIEDDLVCVELDQSLSRPLRLTHDEARALVLAAKVVGNPGGLGDMLEAVVDKLLAKLNPVDAELVRSLSQRIGLWQDDAPAHEPVEILRAGVQQHREVEVSYYSASSDRHKEYRLRPLALIAHSGVDYLVALDCDAENREKLFRLDRTQSARLLDGQFEPPELDLEKFRRPTLYFGSGEGTVEVVFSRRVAEQVRERFADRQVEELDDGTIKVSLSTSSTAWLARWVLPFGADAEVVGPAEPRAQLAALIRDAADAYRD